MEVNRFRLPGLKPPFCGPCQKPLEPFLTHCKRCQKCVYHMIKHCDHCDKCPPYAMMNHCSRCNQCVYQKTHQCPKRKKINTNGKLISPYAIDNSRLSVTFDF